MAEVIPFPLAARGAFVARQADMVLGMKLESGERHILRIVEQQRGVLRRKGVAEFLVMQEGQRFEAAVRAALWRAVMTPGGAA